MQVLSAGTSLFGGLRGLLDGVIALVMASLVSGLGCDAAPIHGDSRAVSFGAQRSGEVGEDAAPSTAKAPRLAQLHDSLPGAPLARSGGKDVLSQDAAAAARTAFAPCGEASLGMACIPGGAFIRGSDHHGRDARPRQVVVVGTFYMDRREVTTQEFVACVKAGLCKPPLQHLRYGGFHGPMQPAVPVSWPNALALCLMQGKRLPTEAEWEKAARTTDGRTYPWGEEAPTCSRAHVRGCKPEVTRPVGSLPPNPYGLYDMAGNGYEWVMDWYAPCYGGCKGACGKECDGPDPRGPCGGALRCPGRRQRVLRGGSWYWPGTHGRTMWRRPEYPQSGGHRLSLRCATRDAAPRPRSAAQVRVLLERLENAPLPL